MSYKYYRQNAYVSMVVEVDGLRTPIPNGSLDAAITTNYNLAIDKQLDDSVQVLYSAIERMRKMSLGSGTRNADTILELRYPPVEADLVFTVQTGRWLYPALGSCVTVGTADGTDSIASGEGTATLTLTTGGRTANDLAGGYILFTSGTLDTNKYHVISNTADPTKTVTLDKVVPAGADGANVSFFIGPFTHNITEQENADLMPSVAMHQEMENTTDAESIRDDALGIIVAKHTHDAEMEAEARQTVSVIMAKSVAGSDLVKPTTLAGSSNIKWGGNAATNTLTYDSGELQSEVDKVSIEILNNAVLRHIFGDSYALSKGFGERDYTIKIHMKPTAKDLKTLRNLAIGSMATALAYTYKLLTSATDYIQYAFDKLYVDDFPLEIPDKANLQYGVDITLKLCGDGACTITVVDSLGLIYYEGSS